MIAQLPDIQNGYILNDLKSKENYIEDEDCNVFMTEIQGVLYNDQITYALSHECQSENINVWNNQKIFKEKNYEFISLLKINNTEKTAAVFRHGFFFNLNPFLPYTSSKNKYKTMELQSNYSAHHSKYEAPLQTVEYFNFDTLLDSLRFGKANIRNLFIKYTFNLNNHIYTLLTPARYINFSHSHKQIHNYIQPISGIVPILHKDKIHLGYIASVLRDGEMIKIECALVEEHNLLDALTYSPFFKPRDNTWKQRLKPIIKQLYSLMLSPIKNVCHLFSYSKKIELQGECIFYRYVNQANINPVISESILNTSAAMQPNTDKKAKEFGDAFKWPKEGDT